LGNALQEKRQTAIHSPDSTDYDSEKKKPKAPEIDRQ
jgi:hypothetical protein